MEILRCGDSPSCVMYICQHMIHMHLPRGLTDWHGMYSEINGGSWIDLEFKAPSTSGKVMRLLLRHPQQPLEYWHRDCIHMKKVDTHMWLQDEQRWVSFRHEHGILTMR